MEFSIGALQEPRGFIRLLEFIFSICAFATTTNFSTYFQFDISSSTGNITDERTVSHVVSYPFKLDHEIQSVDICKQENSLQFFGDYSSDAQFFVAVGVLAFLYSLASLVIFLLYDSLYKTNTMLPIIDFLTTTVLAMLWLSGGAAWASGLNALKIVCDPSNWLTSFAICKLKGPCVTSCVSMYAGSFAGLNVSVIFGFLNFFLWASNLWFTYKDTPWFQQPVTAAAATHTLP